MKLQFIELDKLSVSNANMRHARKAPDVSDILPSVRARGVLQPVLVRPVPQGETDGDGRPQRFEIVAGARRFHAATLVARESTKEAGKDKGSQLPSQGEPPVLPCAVLDEVDDAAAVEASLIENVARLDPGELARWECFTRLVREGRKIADIAATFALPELAVRRALALGNLLPRIRELYRAEKIDAVTMRHLTLATKARQKAWIALFEDPDANAPLGWQVKGWVLGGPSIPARHALFDAAQSGLALVTDLFGEDAYFADGEAFWTLQNAAIEARRCAAIEAGWADARVLGPEAHFHSWEHEKTPKRKGGRVYIDVRGNGEVVIHEGYLPRREAARRKADGEQGTDFERPARPEITATTRSYLDLHRHAALRAALLDAPQVALRAMVAHVLAGSSLWRVSPEPQACRNPAIAKSLAASRGEAVFAARRQALRALLAPATSGAEGPSCAGPDGYEPHAEAGCEEHGGPDARRPLTGEHGLDLVALFVRLLDLPDASVLDLVALAMGESLAAGSPFIEALGGHLGLDMAAWWQGDAAFFDTLRDREVLTALVGEVAGEASARANAREPCRTLRTILGDHLYGHLYGTGSRPVREGWVPRWMTFPPSAYTARGGVGPCQAHARAQASRWGAGEGGDTAPSP